MALSQDLVRLPTRTRAATSEYFTGVRKGLSGFLHRAPASTVRYFSVPGHKIKTSVISAVTIERGYRSQSVSKPPQLHIGVGHMGIGKGATLSRWVDFTGEEAVDAIRALNACGFLSDQELLRNLAQFRSAEQEFQTLSSRESVCT